ncbi:MAG: hypothetical protein JWL61_5185 [Gemmatimonadetes bacterium]|nr:hypothetical protein [Gemmatimonadota bacterium]
MTEGQEDKGHTGFVPVCPSLFCLPVFPFSQGTGFGFGSMRSAHSPLFTSFT